MIGRSGKIGKNVWGASSASVINGVAVGDNSLIGISAAVIRSIDQAQIVVGSPARQLKKSNE